MRKMKNNKQNFDYSTLVDACKITLFLYDLIFFYLFV